MMDVVNTLLLICVGLCATLHINARIDRGTAGCERFGFILAAGGAFGTAGAFWWPYVVDDGLIQFIFHTGLVLIGFSMARDEFRSVLFRTKIWSGICRRSVASPTRGDKQ